MAAPSTGAIPSPLSADYAAAVTPSDATNFSTATRGIYVGVAGNLAVVMASDNAVVTFVGMAAGTILPVRAIRVNSTNTTALSIVALW